MPLTDQEKITGALIEMLVELRESKCPCCIKCYGDGFNEWRNAILAKLDERLKGV